MSASQPATSWVFEGERYARGMNCLTRHIYSTRFAVRHAASKSLAIFGRDPTELGNVLMRIALVKNTASATALFRSILAFSSLHRHGIHSRAIELKISAIKALAAASGSSLDAVEAMQHVAAGMLLSSFEVSILPPHTSCPQSASWLALTSYSSNNLRPTKQPAPQATGPGISGVRNTS